MLGMNRMLKVVLFAIAIVAVGLGFKNKLERMRLKQDRKK